MSGHKINKLIKKFDSAYQEMDYHEMMAMKSEGIEKEEHEDLAMMFNDEIFDIATDIKKLNPSNYMMKKHKDNLTDILEHAI